MSTRPTHWVLTRILAIAFAIVVALPSGVALAGLTPATPTTPAADAVATDLYIVVQSTPPLALYSGGIAGLAATNPGARGEARLKPTSAASLAYLQYLRNERAAVLSAVATVLGRQVNPTRQYNVALNGFAAQLSATEAQRVASLPGIASVQRNQNLETLTDAGPAWMNADDIWDGSAVGGVGSRGERIVAGIIDTGINVGHPSFADPGPVDGYVYSNPRGRFYGACAGAASVPAPGSGCNNKLIGLYDFTGAGNIDDVGHGSHTASTVAGNVVNATLYAPTTTLGPTRISGVAPHANIIAYKACQAANTVVPGANLNLGTCPLDALIAAIDAATADVVDVINFSIGGGSSDPWSGPLQQAFFGTQAAGVFVAASAGNEGPGPQTMGQPANAPWLMAVAASTHNRRPTVSLDASKANGAPIHLEGMAVTSGAGPLPLIDARAIGNDLCNPFDATQAAQVAGKIVVCTQGVIARVEKGQNVKNAGGAGMVLVAGPGYRASSIPDTHVLPAVMISEYDGGTLRNWLAGAVSPSARLSGVTMQTGSELGDRMAAFSSRGPDLSDPNVIKPDVTAPGVAIWAAWMNDNNAPGADFNIIQGTSMSSPHAAGAAALVRAIHPEWNPDQVKSAIMSTAFTVPTGGKETAPILKEDYATPADPFDRGAGRIDVAAAVRAGFTVSETVAAYQAANPALGGSPSALNLASMANDNCLATCTWTRTITNTYDRPVSYAVTTVSDPGFTLSVSPASFTLDAFHAPSTGLIDTSLPSSVTLTITATNTGLQTGAWRFGEVRFAPQGQSGVPGQHFPVAVKTKGAAPEPTCTIPETIVATSTAATNVPDYNDITQLGIAGVYPSFGSQATPNVTFRMRVQQLAVAGALPPNQHWRFAFVPPGAPSGTSYFVAMATNTTGTPSFSYGSLAGGSFTTLGAPDAGSYDLATNDIEWTIATSKILNPQPGSVLSGIVGTSGAAIPGTLTTNFKTVNGSNYSLSSCSAASPTPSAAPTTTPSPTATGNASSELAGVAANVVDANPSVGSMTDVTTDFSAGYARPGTTTWRVVKGTGDCCENHTDVSPGGRLFDIGGAYIYYTDDRGLTWKAVQPPDPLLGAEGSMSMAPNGDVVGVTWDPYTGDRLDAYKYNAASGEWLTLYNQLHLPFYDRPWLTVVPGPFTDQLGNEVPYISIIAGGPAMKDPMFVSYDGLLYSDFTSTTLGDQNPQVTSLFPIQADASFDWIQPIRSATVTALGGGYAFADGGYLFDPTTMQWSPWKLPGDVPPPTYVQIDSAGRIHNIRDRGDGSLEYRISSDNGQSWTSAIFPYPFAPDGPMQTDFKVNLAAGVGAAVVHNNKQDWLYKFDITTDTAGLLRVYNVGKGDVDAGSDVSSIDAPRFDFQTLSIFADGRVAISFLDSTTGGEPAMAIELDSTFEDIAPPTPTPLPTPTPSALPIECPLTTWTDSFEPAATDGWQVDTAENASGPASPEWQLIADPQAHSLTHSWFTNDAVSGPKDDRLIAPGQLISPTTQLTFWHRYQVEEGFDGGVLEVSTNGGQTWLDVTVKGSFVTGGYNGVLQDNRSAWTGGLPGDAMTQVVVSLGGFVPAGQPGANVLVRWRLLSDPLQGGAGWWVDDVAFSDVYDCSGVTPTPTPTATASPTPTPTTCARVTVFSDTLEPDKKSGWTTATAANNLGPLSPTWQVLPDAGAHSASHSWMSDARTVDLKDDRLFAPPFVLTPSTQLSFWHKYFFEDGFDGGVLEISTDGGATWSDVTERGAFLAGAYDGVIETDYGSPIAGRQAWTTGSPTAAVDAMTQVVVDLGGFVPAGETSTPALVRWRLVTDPVAPGALPGLAWWIDDISFSELDPGCVVPTPTPSPQPTPTPTPQVTPTPTPTATSSPTPTLTASPTPTASPSPEPTPTPTPQPTPTSTPTPTPTSESDPALAVLVLNSWKNGALNAGGNSHLRVRGGDIVVDSASRDAAKTTGQAIVVVEAPGLIKVVGQTTGTGFSPPPIQGADSVADPLAGYPTPDTSNMPARSQSSDALLPGVYAGEIHAQGGQSLTLAPGIYVLRHGLKLDKNSSLTGNGVLIFNTVDDKGKCAKIDFDPQATHTLSAPTDGTYRGLLIYQDPLCTEGLKWSATSSSTAVGTIYAPTAELKFDGGVVNLTTQLIIDRLTIGGAVIVDLLFDPNAVAHR